jgi:hypothetical protein
LAKLNATEKKTRKKIEILAVNGGQEEETIMKMSSLVSTTTSSSGASRRSGDSRRPDASHQAPTSSDVSGQPQPVQSSNRCWGQLSPSAVPLPICHSNCKKCAASRHKGALPFPGTPRVREDSFELFFNSESGVTELCKQDIVNLAQLSYISGKYSGSSRSLQQGKVIRCKCALYHFDAPSDFVTALEAGQVTLTPPPKVFVAQPGDFMSLVETSAVSVGPSEPGVNYASVLASTPVQVPRRRQAPRHQPVRQVSEDTPEVKVDTRRFILDVDGKPIQLCRCGQTTDDLRCDKPFTHCSKTTPVFIGYEAVVAFRNSFSFNYGEKTLAIYDLFEKTPELLVSLIQTVHKFLLKFCERDMKPYIEGNKHAMTAFSEWRTNPTPLSILSLYNSLIKTGNQLASSRKDQSYKLPYLKQSDFGFFQSCVTFEERRLREMLIREVAFRTQLCPSGNGCEHINNCSRGAHFRNHLIGDTRPSSSVLETYMKLEAEMAKAAFAECDMKEILETLNGLKGVGVPTVNISDEDMLDTYWSSKGTTDSASLPLPKTFTPYTSTAQLDKAFKYAFDNVFSWTCNFDDSCSSLLPELMRLKENYQQVKPPRMFSVVEQEYDELLSKNPLVQASLFLPRTPLTECFSAPVEITQPAEKQEKTKVPPKVHLAPSQVPILQKEELSEFDKALNVQRQRLDELVRVCQKIENKFLDGRLSSDEYNALLTKLREKELEIWTAIKELHVENSTHVESLRAALSENLKRLTAEKDSLRERLAVSMSQLRERESLSHQHFLMKSQQGESDFIPTAEFERELSDIARRLNTLADHHSVHGIENRLAKVDTSISSLSATLSSYERALACEYVSKVPASVFQAPVDFDESSMLEEDDE